MLTDLTILFNSKQRELHSLLAVLSAIGLNQQISRKKSSYSVLKFSYSLKFKFFEGFI